MADLQALRNELLLKLSDQGSRILTSAQCDSLINNALKEWCRTTEELIQENAFAITAKQFDYPSPTDIIKLSNATFLQSGEYPLEVLNHQELQMHGGYNGRIVGGIPWAISMEGISGAGAYRLRLFPAPGTASQATTLNGAVASASSTTITITDITKLRSQSGWIIVDTEKIFYQGVSGSTIINCRRGMGGTTAATHADLAAVTQLDCHIVYSRKAAVLSANGDVPEIDSDFHNYLVYGALAEALKTDARITDGELMERKWHRLLHDAKRQIKRVRGATPNTLLDGAY